MLKRKLILIVLSMENKMTEDNNVMLQEMHKFNDNLSKIQTELVVTMRINTEICKRTEKKNVSAG